MVLLLSVALPIHKGLPLWLAKLAIKTIMQCCLLMMMQHQNFIYKCETKRLCDFKPEQQQWNL